MRGVIHWFYWIKSVHGIKKESDTKVKTEHKLEEKGDNDEDDDNIDQAMDDVQRGVKDLMRKPNMRRKPNMTRLPDVNKGPTPGPHTVDDDDEATVDEDYEDYDTADQNMMDQSSISFRRNNHNYNRRPAAGSRNVPWQNNQPPFCYPGNQPPLNLNNNNNNNSNNNNQKNNAGKKGSRW